MMTGIIQDVTKITSFGQLGPSFFHNVHRKKMGDPTEEEAKILEGFRWYEFE